MTIVHKHIHTYIHTHIHTHTHTYIHIYIHTYILIESATLFICTLHAAFPTTYSLV